MVAVGLECHRGLQNGVWAVGGIDMMEIARRERGVGARGRSGKRRWLIRWALGASMEEIYNKIVGCGR